MNSIEVEIRSFITKDQHDELLDFFRSHAVFIKEDDQETFYFDCPEDLRIQRNKTGAKIWLKKGKLHDDHREEIEIPFNRSDFVMLEQLFLALGYRVEVKWFRRRFQFRWNGVTVCLDDTKGYGYIIELEQMSDETHQDEALAALKQRLASLHIKETPKAEFEAHYASYKAHWREHLAS